MRTGQRILKATFSATAAFAAVACTIPGIAPEGRTATVSAIAPAARSEVYARAKRWFERGRYVLVEDVAERQLRGYSVIAREGDVETRAVIDFTITGATGVATNYRVTGHTERGRPPTFARAAQNAPETGEAVSFLVSWLSCAQARWPRCP
jgi:hypothetical protein